MTFKPVPFRQGWYGLLAILLLMALDGVLVALVVTFPVSWMSFTLTLLVLLTLPLLLYLAYRTWGCLTLQYWVNRNGVTIVWGPLRQAVPMNDVQRIVRGCVAEMRRPWPWPGRHAARHVECSLGPLTSFATRPPQEQLLLVTSSGSFGISPQDREGFLEALQERRRLGPSGKVPSGPSWPAPWNWHFWQDRTGQGLVLGGLALCLALFGLLTFQFPALPDRVSLHFNAAGMPDRTGPRGQLFILPIIGLIVWAINLLWAALIYRNQRLAAYLLWGGAAAVQILAGLALWSLLR